MLQNFVFALKRDTVHVRGIVARLHLQLSLLRITPLYDWRALVHLSFAEVLSSLRRFVNISRLVVVVGTIGNILRNIFRSIFRNILLL